MEKKEVMSEELALQEIERWADENDIVIIVYIQLSHANVIILDAWR